MAEIQGLAGNRNNINYISKAYARGKLSHAYIIEGPEDSGKELFAERMAQALLCRNARPGEELFNGHVPCGTCSACAKTFTGNHPDLIHVRHEKETVLSVGEIREQVVADLAIKPYYGPYKIYIIRDAQLMNESAQNALLKTMEEPAGYGIILLLTDNADGFLQTIRSRCIRIRMEQVPGRQEAAHLLDEEGTRTLEILEQILSMDALQINKASKELEGFRRDRILKLMRLWFRDLLVYKSIGTDGTLYFPDRSILRDTAARVSYECLNRILAGIDETEARLKASVKAEAAYETLLLTIRRNLR
ncbi:MAG: DNA polymerase III subunit [Parasporobacterium sp.]|nr:DNA polymerase III subunit [Parasporobacterium sp.]